MGIQGQLEELKDQRTALEKERDNAQRQVTIGGIGVLLGLFMFFAIGGFWAILGAFIGLAGLLAVLTNIGKRSTANTKLTQLNEQISELRKQL